MAQNRNARLLRLQVLALNKIGAGKVLWNNELRVFASLADAKARLD
jgi:hypothetical protein